MACGERDAFPAGDLGLRRGASGAGPLVPVDELEAHAEGWRPWRAYAAAHLWRLATT
jgi:3-methyladenine DNA glycosylase/8-oxoguanine DNA glycosylase